MAVENVLRHHVMSCDIESGLGVGAGGCECESSLENGINKNQAQSGKV